MPSRQDQLHSYQFTIQRVVAAVVMRETDPPQSPFRRLAGAALASVLVAAIGLGGFALYGLFVGGGVKWRDGNAVIVEKESGARFVYREQRLHPVLNYASALLIIGAERPKTVLVSRRSIEGVPRGLPLGIADAPDSLPAAARLAGDAWTVCSVDTTEDGRRQSRSVLLIGSGAAGGRPLGEEALLLRAPDGQLHLLWQQRRHLIRDTDRVLAALAVTRARAVPVAAALLNTVPAGLDLAPLELPGLGEWSTRIADARIGDVLLVKNSGGTRQHAVVQRDGLAGITELQAALLLARTGQRAPEEISLGRFAALPKRDDLTPTGPHAPPHAPPRLATMAAPTLCAGVADEAGQVELRHGAELPELTAAPRASSGPAGPVVADHVLVEPGRGALVESVPAPGATGGAISVVTDLGRRHVLADAGVRAMLGYGESRPLRLPAGVVSLVPAGAGLDPAAARQTAAPA
ncbi:type VII secretion protein EccB [Micromonospora endophytica]|uniref:Type VII secretion protein EccB n=1 Tax=Micromonospora endophytica TaxID=515350 RepID=A0A2W2D2E1_9ACTN|nr:type VII secretion protein EccB [Micromonospora endophytica]PZF91446.1 type VII secretion protein EccB [Micromonospora endophytica]RIW44350.1 type VII secretion protein EccB [Micromonospora endophytica]BCJ62455.1 type VII secretion protein EccB [Micromonospora endophytica]